MAFILFLIIFFCLQSFVLFCCVAAGNDPASQLIYRSGTDGLYQNLDGKSPNVKSLKNKPQGDIP